MINAYKNLFLITLFFSLVYIFTHSFPSYAFFSEAKIIKCEDGFTLLYEKKLFQEPSVTVRDEGIWKSWCEGSGKYGGGALSFNNDSFHCKRFKNKELTYSGLFDFVTKQFKSVLIFKSTNTTLKGNKNCVVEDYK